MPTSKRQKVESVEKQTILPIDRSTEVEDILSGKVLDTDIPGLEELMSTESKQLHFCFNIIYNFERQKNMPLAKLHLQINIFFHFVVFGPLMRLSPPPSEKDYCFNLDDSEGVCDLFDVQ